MGRAPCCDKANVKRGPWSPEEDIKLKEYIDKYGTGGNWIALPHKAGLKRCGKSCRLRWLNYLRPNLKHGEFSDEEDRIICSLFASIGSRWSIIAAQLPGRTDNDIKNYWNTKLKKKLLGIAPSQKKLQNQHQQQQQPHQLLFPSTSPPPPLSTFASSYSPSPMPNISQDVFSSLVQAAAVPSLNQYKISFGSNEHSCSSSDISYGKDQMEFENHYGNNNGDNVQIGVGFDQSYVTTNNLYGGGQVWGSSELAPLEYGYDEIKQLISTPSNYNYINGCNNNTFLDDPTTSSATREKVMYF